MFGPRRVESSISQKIRDMNLLVVLVLVCIASTGIAMLYSVAGGDFNPWASRQAIRFGILLLLFFGIALTDLRVWMSLAYPAYILGVLTLIAVEFVGAIGMGGMRWLDLGVMRIQPSEIMKILTIMALARYFHGLSYYESLRIKSLIVPVVLILIPSILILRQPDLGTTLLLVFAGIAMIFLSGARVWIFVTGLILSLASIPLGLQFMQGYQRERILTFLNPERDPLGAGYQIMQSKIALGSGGLFGKGFLQGTQSHLNFLPEMKTDFIFTVLAEEFGLVGGATLIFLYFTLLGYGAFVSLTCRSHFGRMLSMGITVTIFLYVFINIAMVMGLVPVVGVPLPMVSYGGSAMLTMMVGYGLIMSVSLHRGLSIPRKHAFG